MSEEKPIKIEIQKIIKEAKEAGCTEWDLLKIIKNLEKQELTITEMRNNTIQLLEEINPKAAEVYASFNKIKVFTSEETIKPFDRGNIIKSLIKETNIPRSMAEKIGGEVEDKIKDLNLNHITTTLIRQMVNTKLLEYGHETTYQQYARVGLPVYDIAQNIYNEKKIAKELLKEYTWLSVIPKTARRLHFESDIYICAVEDFCTKPYLYNYNPKLESETKRNALLELITNLNKLKDYVTNSPSINAINTIMSKYIKNEQQTKNFSKQILKNINAIYYNKNGLKPSLGLDLFTREEFYELKKKKEFAITLANDIIQNYFEEPKKYNFSLKICLDNKYKLKLLEKESITGNLIFLNCKNNELNPLNELHLNDKKGGINCFVGLNLYKLAKIARGNEDIFLSRVKDRCQTIKELGELKKEELEKRKEDLDKYFNQDEFRSEIGLAFLKDSAEQITGNNNKKEILRLSDKIIREIKQELDDWNIAPVTQKEVLTKFENFNIERYDDFSINSEDDFVYSKDYNKTYEVDKLKDLEEILSENTKSVRFSFNN